MITLVIFILLFISPVHAAPKVLYGQDDRLEVDESGRALYKTLARSSAAMIPAERLQLKFDLHNGPHYRIVASLLKDWRFGKFCPEVRYQEQIMAADCSGFLVGPDVIATAAHCIQGATCAGSKWVFDYVSNSKIVKTADVYRCKEVIAKKYVEGDLEWSIDYALVRLDRRVKGRQPLKVRQFGVVGDNTPLLVIGNPMGLPTKLAVNGAIRDNSFFNLFVATLDTFGGNSGSAVIDAGTGIVEGILVGGDTDFVPDKERGCLVEKKCAEDECSGEVVTRITSVTELGEINAF